MKKISSKRRMDAENRWWVAELLAVDCEKAPSRRGRNHAKMEMKKEDEKRKMEELHQQMVNHMIKSAEGSAGLLHKFTKPTAWRGGVKELEERRTSRG